MRADLLACARWWATPTGQLAALRLVEDGRWTPLAVEVRGNRLVPLRVLPEWHRRFVEDEARKLRAEG